METKTVDVLIVGGGPVGLCLAYQLKRFHPATTVHIVEKHPKPAQEAFGRAVTFWPRSMEILDQIGLGEAICQQCVAVRGSACYDEHGAEVFGRGWSFLEGIEDTRYQFASVLRQKYVEEIFRGKLDGMGVRVKAPASFEGLTVDEGVPLGDHRVTATISDTSGDVPREYEVRCRYLIGCDGSRTAVRGAAGIDSDGDRTEDKWVRIDGVLKSTTMPKPRCYGAIESPLYGNVLWIPLDHGATRIGFALSEERRKLYPELTREVFIKEAKLSVQPFDIEYERVDWASVYSVGQRVAKTLCAKGCVFLAGDSGHTHSSGAGQGMNAGMHDAANLGWKMSLVLQGLGKAEELLGTYDNERRPNAEKLIKYDESISVLVTGRLPKGYQGEEKDPHLALGTILKEAKGFNTGLTIGYEENLAVARSERNNLNGNADGGAVTIPAPAKPGFRAPDVKLLLPALWEPAWLQNLTPNVARFYALLFVNTEQNGAGFRRMKQEIDRSPLFAKGSAVSKPGPEVSNGLKSQLSNGHHPNGVSSKASGLPLDFLTIVRGTAANAWHLLGTDPFGRVFYDEDGSAHERYGVDGREGAVLILRPDGWIGARYGLDSEELVQSMEVYFRGFLNV